MINVNWSPSVKDLRKFGVTIFLGFGLIGLIFRLRGFEQAGATFWILGAALSLLALSVPMAAKPFYWLWMGFSFVMGTIMSAAILTLIFYVILTPLGLLMRLFGRDTLHLKREPVSSYWVDHPALDDKNYYERIF